MNKPQSDALVFFGATGDLAFKKIYPTLQSMIKRGNLDVPIIGIGRSDWDAGKLRERAFASIEKHGDLDTASKEKLGQLLRYVKVDYSKPSTFDALRKELGTAQHPAHFLAIPPNLFGTVIDQLDASGCAKGARVLIEKPFGRDLESAKELNRILHGTFEETDIFRIDHYLGKQAVNNLRFFRFANPILGPIWNHEFIESMQITGAENFGVQGRGGFYEEAGAIRDVIQNHLFQVLSNLTMEPESSGDIEALRDEKVKVLKAIPALQESSVVRGQFSGYRSEQGVDPDSRVETYAALRLEINNDRWQGVPFYIRAGKNLPVNCTEVVVKLRRSENAPQLDANYIRMRISPEIEMAMGINVFGPDEENPGIPIEMMACRESGANEKAAYERVLGDAMKGDTSLFARQDYAEEAWRIVDPITTSATSIYQYEPQTWGPAEGDSIIMPPGGWVNPTETEIQS